MRKALLVSPDFRQELQRVTQARARRVKPNRISLLQRGCSENTCSHELMFISDRKTWNRRKSSKPVWRPSREPRTYDRPPSSVCPYLLTPIQINALRKLYATFGHLFCQSVTLGGCLQTTKVVEGTENTTQSKEKEDFKADVGVAVSTVLIPSFSFFRLQHQIACAEI